MPNEYPVIVLAAGVIVLTVLAVISSVLGYARSKRQPIPQIVAWSTIAAGDTVMWEDKQMQVVNVVTFPGRITLASVLLRQVENPDDFVHAVVVMHTRVIKLVKP